MKGIIFDFNGVLLFDIPLHTKAWQVVLKEVADIDLTAEEFEEKYNGRSAHETFEVALSKKLSDEEANKYADHKEEIYRSLALQEEVYDLSPGTSGLLDELKNKHIPFTIATSSDLSNMRFYFEHLNLSSWFSLESIVYYTHGAFPSKPAPDIYLKAAEKLGLEPKECIVFEDAFAGIQSAQNAGIGKIVGVGPKEKFQNSNLFTVVSDLTQVDIQSLLA